MHFGRKFISKFIVLTLQLRREDVPVLVLILKKSFSLICWAAGTFELLLSYLIGTVATLGYASGSSFGILIRLSLYLMDFSKLFYFDLLSQSWSSGIPNRKLRCSRDSRVVLIRRTANSAEQSNNRPEWSVLKAHVPKHDPKSSLKAHPRPQSDVIPSDAITADS